MKKLILTLSMTLYCFVAVLSFASCTNNNPEDEMAKNEDDNSGDDGNDSNTDDTTVTLTALDFEVTVNENTESEQVLDKLNATTTVGTLSFTKKSSDGEGAIKIEADGTIKVDNSSELDFEKRQKITVIVTVTNGTVSKDITLTVTIKDVDEDINNDDNDDVGSDLPLNTTKTPVLTDYIESKVGRLALGYFETLDKTFAYISSNNMNLSLEFKGQIKEGTYEIKDANALADILPFQNCENCVKIKANIGNPLVGDKKFIIDVGEKTKKKLKIEKNNKDDYVIILSETKGIRSSVSTTIEFKVSLNLQKNKITGYDIGSINIAAQSDKATTITLSSDKNLLLSNFVCAIWLPVDIAELRGGDIAKTTVDLFAGRTLDGDFKKDYMFQYEARFYPIEGGKLTYEVVDGIFKAELTDLKIKNSSTDEEKSINGEFYVVL